MWTRIGGLLAACLVIMFAAGPFIDAVVCRDDLSAPITATLEAHTVMASDAADHSGGAEKHGSGACIHGHCHHAMAFSAALADASAAEAPQARLEALPADQRHPSQGLPRLERPPRA